MELIVDKHVFERFPGMRIVGVVAAGVDNSVGREAVDELWRDAWNGCAAAREYGNAQSHPSVSPWRSHFRAMGVSPKEFPSSIEAMLRRAMKGGEPFSINPLVDFYNSISLRHVVPAGGFDLDDLAGPLELRLTRAGDTFESLDANAQLCLPAGEVAYASGTTVLTRHFVWRQSRAGLITPRSSRVVLLAEVLGEVGEATAEMVTRSFSDGLRDLFGVASTPFVTHADALEARIE